MIFIFWHHSSQGPFNLQDLFHGCVPYAGTVQRLRILFWLAERGHDVSLVGNVDDDNYKGVKSLHVNNITHYLNFTQLNHSPKLLILNHTPVEDDWTKVNKVKAENLFKILWSAGPIDTVWMFRAYHGLLDKIVFISNFQRDLYRIYPGFRSTEVIYLGVDLDYFKQDAIKLNRIPTIISISIPRYSKGFHHLLRAWRIVHRKFPEARLKICGSASMHDVNARIGKTGILDEELECEFSDIFGNHPISTSDYGIDLLLNLSIPEVLFYLQNSDIAIVNSNTHGSIEMFCRSAVEAQAAGVPVIGGNAGSLREVIRDGVTGFLVNGENTTQFANYICRLIDNVDLRNKMAMAGPEWIRPIADYTFLTPKWEELARNTADYHQNDASIIHYKDILRYLGFGKIKFWIKSQTKNISI